MIDPELLRAIRHDIRAWPGGRSIHDDYEPDAFAPTTLAVVAELFPGAAEALIARAQTADWGPRDAEALLDLIVDRLCAAAYDADVDAFAARLRHAARGRLSAETKRAHFSVMQEAVLAAAARLGVLERLLDPVLARGTAASIQRDLDAHAIPTEAKNRLREMRHEKRALLEEHIRAAKRHHS